MGQKQKVVAMSPGIGVVSNVCQIDVAVSVLLVDSDVLPVTARRSLQLNISQPSTWSGSEVRSGLVSLGRGQVMSGCISPCSEIALIQVLPPESLCTHKT